jgi:hypothetical protein
MRITWGVSLLLCLTLTAGNRVRADDQAEMKTLLAKAIKAIGGAKKIAKHKAATWNFKGKVYVIGNGSPFTAEWLVQAPHQAKATVTVEVNCNSITIVRVLNKAKGWEKVGDKTVAMNKAQHAEIKDQMYFYWLSTLVPLTDKAFTLSPVGEVKVGKRDAVGMKVTRKGSRDVNLYFDKKTHLLLKLESFIKDPLSNKEVSEHWSFDDYKDIEGAKYPMKVTIQRDGKKYIDMAETTEFKPEEKLEDSEFEKP